MLVCGCGKGEGYPLTMFTSDIESMLAMLMLIPTITGRPKREQAEEEQRVVTNTSSIHPPIISSLQGNTLNNTGPNN